MQFEGGFFIIIIITLLLKKAVSQHAASRESKQADPAAPRRHFWQQSPSQTALNSLRLGLQGRGGGDWDTKAATTAGVFPCKKISQEQFCLNTCGITLILGGSGGILALYLSSVTDDTCFLTFL